MSGHFSDVACKAREVTKSAGSSPRHRESLESSLGIVNKEDLPPQMKDQSEASKTLTESHMETCTRVLRPISDREHYAKCTDAEKISRKRYGQVNVMVAESVKGNSLEVPSVLCETQLRLPAEGERASVRGRH